MPARRARELRRAVVAACLAVLGSGLAVLPAAAASAAAAGRGPARAAAGTGSWWLGSEEIRVPTLTPTVSSGDAVLSPGSVAPPWWRRSGRPTGPSSPGDGSGPPITPSAPTVPITPPAPTLTLTPTPPTLTPTPVTEPGGYSKVAVWASPHEDDEGSLWADQLNNDTGAFPVFVYLTNGENTGY
ncbi:MAG TPA: hypothetical protein VFH45_06565, partial [Acidimicrobiales bacterium]|nr:hypothetical protein [Acidimicrobiales bacterium]